MQTHQREKKTPISISKWFYINKYLRFGVSGHWPFTGGLLLPHKHLYSEPSRTQLVSVSVLQSRCVEHNLAWTVHNQHKFQEERKKNVTKIQISFLFIWTNCCLVCIWWARLNFHGLDWCSNGARCVYLVVVLVLAADLVDFCQMLSMRLNWRRTKR